MGVVRTATVSGTVPALFETVLIAIDSIRQVRLAINQDHLFYLLEILLDLDHQSFKLEFLYVWQMTFGLSNSLEVKGKLIDHVT